MLRSAGWRRRAAALGFAVVVLCFLAVAAQIGPVREYTKHPAVVAASDARAESAFDSTDINVPLPQARVSTGVLSEREDSDANSDKSARFAEFEANSDKRARFAEYEANRDTVAR
jgi:hypothetical protein